MLWGFGVTGGSTPYISHRLSLGQVIHSPPPLHLRGLGRDHSSGAVRTIGHRVPEKGGWQLQAPQNDSHSQLPPTEDNNRGAEKAELRVVPQVGSLFEAFRIGMVIEDGSVKDERLLDRERRSLLSSLRVDLLLLLSFVLV